MDMVFSAFVVLLFAAVILLVEGTWLWWSASHGGGARRIAKRLRLMSARGEGGADRVSILKQRRYSTNPWLEARLRRLPQLALLDRLLLQAGGRWSVAQLLAWSAGLLLAGLVLPPLWQPPLALLLAAPPLGAALPYLLLLRLRRARLHRLERQLPETADFLGRALRAGHSFSNVLQMVADELTEPIAGEFRATYEEINYGVPMNEALQNLALRIPLTDLRYLVIAVLIQRESGGNLAEVLGNISRLIRERLKLQAQVHVMSAEGRLSAWILVLLPLVVMLVMSVTNYAYISVLWTDPAGATLLWYAAGGMAIGIVWMRHVIRIRI
ncbi:type II secretion system F family protein [Rugamonas sp. CCM 8940]|uniref:type II secretion system F family protein n=1 Tax=Rugamonas sp. CCM 8940 TaxID=2765359 RepID=UPI0018F39C91|nr:type II secretion system F family protein [Rugamonas sp. CCM 8940]MBJ7309515.1 type II secretion system F family protein [Rugamonas sp. CCM 8940]